MQLTPVEYIQSLKEANPPTSVTKESLPETVKAQITAAGQCIDAAIESLNNTDWAQTLLDTLKPSLDTELQRKIDSGHIAIGMINKSTPEIFVKSIGEGYAIVFNTGMKDFIYRIARILATRLKVSSVEQMKFNDEDITETARRIADVFWWFKTASSSYGPQYPISIQQIRFASMLASHAETFLIAHELGHIMEVEHEEKHAEIFGSTKCIETSHRSEYTADLLGVIITTIASSSAKDGFNAPLAYAGAEFALQVYRGLEKLGVEFEQTHPPTQARLDKIRSEMRRRCPDEQTWLHLSSLGNCIEKLFTEVIRIIARQGVHEDTFKVEADRMIAELNTLLLQNCGDITPNYYNFYNAAGAIFSQGHSEALMHRITLITQGFRSEMENPRGGARKAQIAFQKFKLIVGYVRSHVPEPARSTYLQALGL